MNCHLTFSLAISMTLSTLAIPLRAANTPRAGTDSQNTVVWTNDDLERLHVLGLISIVGRMNEETPKSASLPQPYVKTHRTRSGMRSRQRSCAMDLNADRINSVITGRRST